MDSERWQRIADLYQSVLARPPLERGQYLASASGDDTELRREVESLLAQEHARLVIDRPILETAAAILDVEEPNLAAGTQIGPYRIDRFLDGGGMGRVYRATDVRLNRTVAIKVLSPRLANDPQYRARFDREARAIAGLAHPHLCTLHDVGHQDGIDFLVMEYLEGETLAARLDKGPLPLDLALRYSIEIANALTVAHGHGVIHRDLKPGNIVLTKGGAKLLDFGLARPGPSVTSGRSSLHPTKPPRLTAEGTILGTCQYMAPEQLEGKEADARSDIFAFGAVVYEMLTGKKAFEGTSHASLIAAIMRSEPAAVATVQPMTPRFLDRIVRTCLAKDPDDRWQTAQDLSRALRWVGQEDAEPTLPTQPPSRRRFILAAAAAFAASTGYAVWVLKPASPNSTGVTRFSITLPQGLRLNRPVRHVLALSPDGSRLILAADRQLYVRAMADEELHPLAGSTDQDVSGLFFSADGRWIGFWASDRTGPPRGTLRKVAIGGGAPVVICEAMVPFGASWGVDNQILIGGGRDGIQRVSAAGGTPETIIKVNPRELASSPQLLPDREHVLFTLGEQGADLDPTRQRNWDRAKIVVQSLKTGDRKVLIEGGSDARYIPTGHILYALAATLWGRPFDLSRLEVGDPVALVDNVRTAGSGRFTAGAAHFSVSANGTVAYLPGTASEPSPTRSLALIDMTGSVTRLDLPAGRYHSPRFSLPDGKQIALYTSDGVIWIHDLSGRKPIGRLTLDGGHVLPMWTRDGRVVFRSGDGEQAGLFWQRADGSSPAERLTEQARRSYFPYSIAPDGKTLVLLTDRTAVQDRTGGQAVVTLALTGDKAPRTLFEAPNGEIMFSPSISPDSRSLAYEWRHEGRSNIYLDPLPPTGGHHQVTTDGGSNPMWSPDGRRLLYVEAKPGGRTTFYSIEILRTGASFEHGKPTELFSIDGLFVAGSGPGNVVDLSPDGKRFVALLVPPRSENEDEQVQVNVILNWFAELTARVPTR